MECERGQGRDGGDAELEVLDGSDDGDGLSELRFFYVLFILAYLLISEEDEPMGEDER